TWMRLKPRSQLFIDGPRRSLRLISIHTNKWWNTTILLLAFPSPRTCRPAGCFQARFKRFWTRGTCSTSPLGLRERRPDNTHGLSKAASTSNSNLPATAPRCPLFYTQAPKIYIRLLLIRLSLALSVLFFGTRVAKSRSNGTEDLFL